jgi:hypothetical protein
MAARISNDGLWRVTYGELPGLTFDELKARQPEKFKKMLPGHPDPEDYKMINFSPYKVHQRLAKQMRVGKVLLAADAAHCKWRLFIPLQAPSWELWIFVMSFC